MSSTEESEKFNATESERTSTSLYTPEVSSCCSFLVAVVLIFGTSNAIIEHSITPSWNSTNTGVILAPYDYAISYYSLLVIVTTGVIVGYITQLCRLPSLLGMLVVGIALRNMPIINDYMFVVKEWSVILRRVAFVVILLRGGLSLDAEAIRRLKGACIRLSFIPCTVEALIVALSAKLVFGMDILFGILLGSVLAAVSPAVVIPALLDAAKTGYGVDSGVPSLVIAAASLDDVYAITIFSLTLTFLFPSGKSLWMTILSGPAEVVSGLFFGCVAGLLLHHLPRKDVKNLHLIRTTLIFFISTTALFGSARFGVDGAGAIAVIACGFVAGNAWKKEGELPEEDCLANMWHLVFQPLLFGLIGFELSFDMVKVSTLSLGVLVLTIGLVFRLIASFVAVCGAGLTKREQLFVSVAWLPKATVQAALAPAVLDLARTRNDARTGSIESGIIILTVAILSILITAPVGAFLIRMLTPVLLTKRSIWVMHKLVCAVQTYGWGKPGNRSTVAALVRAGQHAKYVDDEKPYAEFWMGVHPNGPSKIAETSEDLANRIKNHPELIGSHEGGTLQYLFKVLSVEKALSVQSHPTKEEGKVLHAKDPKNYPDPNHKPEMAIALTEFELLCGFRPPREIYANLTNSPELLGLLGSSEDLKAIVSDDANVAKEALKKVFTKIWSSSPETITKTVAALVERLKGLPEPQSKLNKLIIRLDNTYPGGDVGVFAPLLLNYFTLKPGQATFLGPNQPHAYLSGDCIECMACSDNTIRAGLTPKFKDIETLCANLTYEMSEPPIFSHKEVSHGVRLYAPPVSEFAVQALESGATKISAESASSIVIVVDGTSHFKTATSTMEVHRGDVIFISASTGDVNIEKSSSDFVCYRAFTPKH
ncbi:hypothetical protein Q1695_000744 [Nippostrongylus brasiliensis]|nr:hypothetical protein Q1695_000744 [Nippostrongylus brasiliensis]